MSTVLMGCRGGRCKSSVTASAVNADATHQYRDCDIAVMGIPITDFTTNFTGRSRSTTFHFASVLFGYQFLNCLGTSTNRRSGESLIKPIKI